MSHSNEVAKNQNEEFYSNLYLIHLAFRIFQNKNYSKTIPLNNSDIFKQLDADYKNHFVSKEKESNLINTLKQHKCITKEVLKTSGPYAYLPGNNTIYYYRRIYG